MDCLQVFIASPSVASFQFIVMIDSAVGQRQLNLCWVSEHRRIILLT